jgi:hypothetical protein
LKLIDESDTCRKCNVIDNCNNVYRVDTCNHTARHSCSVNDPSSNAAIEVLAAAIKQNKLPNLELSVFNGDPTDYVQWMMSFEKLIEDSTDDIDRRLNYMKQYTSGHVKQLVISYMNQPNRASYDRLKRQQLAREYGNAESVARAYLRKIDDFKPINSKDIEGLRSFSILLQCIRGAMHSLAQLQQLNTDLYKQRIVSKLPGYLQISWCRHAYNLEANDRLTTFDDLVECVEKEAHIARHPVYSQAALCAAVDTQPKASPNTYSNKASTNFASGKQIKVCATVDGNQSSDQSASKSLVFERNNIRVHACPICNGSHDLEECSKFVSMNVNDRKQFLVEHKLCFGCFKHMSRQHTVKTCKRRKSCKICHKIHPTTLHDLPRFRGPVGSTDKPSVETSCSTRLSSNLKSKPVLMSVVLVNVRDGGKVSKTYCCLDTLSSACFIASNCGKTWALQVNLHR